MNGYGYVGRNPKEQKRWKTELECACRGKEYPMRIKDVDEE